MKNSPLRLEGHFFSRIEMQAHSDAVPGAEPQLKTVSELHQDPEEGGYLVTVRVEISRADESANPTYTGLMEVRGIFRTAEGYPVERCDEMVYVNGSTLLYGAAREMLLNLTSRGPWPPVMLPSVRFTNDRPEAVPLDDPEAAVHVLPTTPSTAVGKTKPASAPGRKRQR